MAEYGPPEIRVISSHKCASEKLTPIWLPRGTDPESYARASAQLGYDAFLRVFLSWPAGRERFLTAWSVLDGTVSEYRDVTIPERHW